MARADGFESSTLTESDPCGGMQHLDRDIPFEPRIPCAIDRRRSATATLPFDDVAIGEREWIRVDWSPLSTRTPG